MHEASAGLPININISTIGYCSPTYSPQFRVGKSCLIHRFMNLTQYTEDHLSVISNSDYCGSIIDGSQWIYWGSKIIQHDNKRFRLRIIEQCDFIDDHLFKPLGSASDSYIDRCFENIIRVDSPKTAYICKDQVGNEWNYPREILEPGDFMVDVFIVVVDITLTGEAAVSQQKFLKKALTELRKRKIPFVFASSKHDCEASSENKEFLKHLLHKVSKSLKKTRCCRVETSARLNINVYQAFLSAALLCTPSYSEINCKYFPYLPPLDVAHQSPLNPSIRSRHSDRAGTIVSIYADSNSNPLDTENFRPPPRIFNRFSLTESSAYDLPIEGKTLTNQLCCQVPITISSDTSGQISLWQRSPRLLEPSGACASHVCYETISPNSKFPPIHHQMPPQMTRPQITHIVHQSPNTLQVTPTPEMTPTEPVTPQPKISASNSTSQPLLMLFLSGPGASKLKTILQRQCYRDRLHLSNDQCFRVWIFDAVDPHSVQISPSKWQPHHALHPSPSAPSAFTTPAHNNLSNIPNAGSSNGNSGDGNSPSESTNSECSSRQRQLKLSLWAMDMSIMELTDSQKSPPKNIDAVVFRAAADNPTVDEYYDEVGGDYKVELSKAFNLANLLRVSLFCIAEEAPSSLLASLLFFAKNLSLFKTLISKDSSIPCLLPEAQQTVNIPLLLQVCSIDSDENSPVNSLASITEGAEVAFEQEGGGGDDDETTRSETSALSGQRIAVFSSSQISSPSFQYLPRVAIGLDFSTDFTLDRRDEQSPSALSPLVIFVTIYQALQIFSQLQPTVARCRFALLHFPTSQWAKLCGEITSQLEILLNTASSAFSSLENEDDRSLILMLVAVSPSDATRPRQLINGLAAQQTCRIWHPRLNGHSLPRCLQEDMVTEASGDVLSNKPFRPSLAFLHVQSENTREFELYRQVLNGDMSSWFLSYSPDYALTTNRIDTVESRCSQGDDCEMCRHRHREFQHNSLPNRQSHQLSIMRVPSSEFLHRYSPILATNYHQHKHGACCAATMAGISDEDYVDASFQFPESGVTTSIAPAPSVISPLPPAHISGLSSTYRNGETEEKLSEHYEEFSDLFNEAVSKGIDPVTRQNRPHRPQAPTLVFSSSPPIIFPPSPASRPAPSSPSSPATPSTASVASLTLSSLITSYTSSSPDRGVIDFRSQRGLFRSCSDTPPTSPEKIGEVASTFTPIPDILAARRMGYAVETAQEDAYEPVYEEPIQLECQSVNMPLGLYKWKVASSIQTGYPNSTLPQYRLGREWTSSSGRGFCWPTNQRTEALKSEIVEIMDGPSDVSTISASVAAAGIVSPSLGGPYSEDNDTIRLKYGARRSIPTLIDSRRKNTSSNGHTFSPLPTEPIYYEPTPPSTPLCPEAPLGNAVVEELVEKSGNSGSKHSNKILGGLKSAFKRRGSLFRSNNRKSNAKH
nr:rho GTPase activating protein [Hymenolepis microstoma]